jgi:hypothetical protein
VAVGQGARGRIQVDKEAVTCPRELIMHDRVKRPVPGDWCDRSGKM